MKFNNTFYQSNLDVKREDAEEKLLSLGYKNFTFKSMSRANGVSFYFYAEDGKILRISDHPLTGKRAFEITSILFKEPKELKAVKVKNIDNFKMRLQLAIEKRNQTVGTTSSIFA